MSYKFLDDITTADVAFEASGKDLSELFGSAGLALTEAMVDPGTVDEREEKKLKLREKSLENLLHGFLEELIFMKDVENFLLKTIYVEIDEEDESCVLRAVLKGEVIDRKKHALKNDIKAVTLYKFELKKKGERYWARVVVDV